MPRKSRIDATGALHHVMVRGIERGMVFRNDERILGDGEFVGSVLAAAEEAMEKRYTLRARGVNLAFIASRVS